MVKLRVEVLWREWWRWGMRCLAAMSRVIVRDYGVVATVRGGYM